MQWKFDPHIKKGVRQQHASMTLAAALRYQDATELRSWLSLSYDGTVYAGYRVGELRPLAAALSQSHGCDSRFDPPGGRGLTRFRFRTSAYRRWQSERACRLGDNGAVAPAVLTAIVRV